MDKPQYIDLFAGCGGLSLGLKKAGWKGVFAVEKNKDAFSTLKHNLIDNKSHFNWPKWLPLKNHDINKLMKDHEDRLRRLSRQVTLVAGGPPCQGFSMAGLRQRKDKRNKLVDSYIKFIKIVKPKLVFFENVKGFTFKFKDDGHKAKAYSSYVVSELRKLGYDVHGEIVDFSDFGVPQTRKRFILVGTRVGNAESFFNDIVNNKVKFLKSKGLSHDTSLNDAIGDLLNAGKSVDSPDSNGFKAGVYHKASSSYQKLMRGKINKGSEPVDSHRFVNHRPETVKKFAIVLKSSCKGKNAADYLAKKFDSRKKCVFVLDKNTSSPTLTTLPDDYIHFSEPRILTPREYARIQSFPDSFEFKGKYTTGGKRRVLEVPRYTQIGNAIPPLFAEQSGLVLKQMVNKR